MSKSSRTIVDHEGHRIMVYQDNKSFIYSIYKFVNGERFAIHRVLQEDTEATRGTFIKDALEGFERARTAPFN